MLLLGTLACGAWTFVAGVDLQTLQSAHASRVDKFLAVVDLASNALLIVPGVGEGIETARG